MACAVADRGFKSVGDVGWAVSRSRGGSSANGCSRELGEQEGGWLLDVTGRYHGLAMDEPFLTSVKARQGKARQGKSEASQVKSSQVKSSQVVRSGQVKSRVKARQSSTQHRSASNNGSRWSLAGLEVKGCMLGRGRLCRAAAASASPSASSNTAQPVAGSGLAFARETRGDERVAGVILSLRDALAGGLEGMASTYHRLGRGLGLQDAKATWTFSLSLSLPPLSNLGRVGVS
jgi:hypothetical protein